MLSSYLPVSTKDTDIPLTAQPPRGRSRASGPASPTAHMATTTLRVEGMTCGACTSAIESGFRNVKGVGSVSVSLVMGRAVVVHDPEIMPAEGVREIIDDRGFDATVLSTDLKSKGSEDEGQMSEDEDKTLLGTDAPVLSTTTLAVEGMTCGACTSAIESGFKDVAGVKSFNVSLLSERAVVEHDPSVITPSQIAEIIEDRGFEASIQDTVTSGPKGGSRKANKRGSSLAKTTVAVEGMTCGACTSAVEEGFRGLEGLSQFNISLLAERAVLIHDPAKLSAETIVKIIEDRGFDARLLSSQPSDSCQSGSTASIQFKIFGLTDSSSASSLESMLRAKPGVTSALVNLSTARATVVYQPSVCGLRALVEAVESLGLNALVSDNEDNNAQLESLAKTREIQEWRRAFRLSLSFAIPVFLISMVIPMFFPRLDFGHVELPIRGLYLGDVLCLGLTIPVQFGIGKRFYKSAYRSLRHGSPTMDVLVVLGTSTAFFFSVAAMIVSVVSEVHSRPSTVFDTSTMLITFITLGRYIENRAKGQTSKALSNLMSLAPSMATIYTDPIAAEKVAEGWDVSALGGAKGDTAREHSGSSGAAEEKVIPTELLQVGDIVILRPGDKIPADGTVTKGESHVDESMVTGEAMPLSKKKGSFLVGGTVNRTGRLDFRVTRAGRDTQLSQIVKLVQEAQTSRAPIQRMADIVAGYFVPAIAALGLLTFVSWMILSHVLPHPPAIFLDKASGGTVMVCMKLCISVIVFACPCALGLSTPTAVMVGTGVGAENGILVKGGAALETATKVTHVVLDKTGTLTMGKMTVVVHKRPSLWDSNEWRRKLWWTLIGLAETGSEHPVGKAVLAGAKEELGFKSEGAIDGSVEEFKAVVGRGVNAIVEPTTAGERQRHRVIIGNVRYLRENGVPVPEDAIWQTESGSSSTDSSNTATHGTTYVFVAIDATYAGFIGLSDELKPDARYAVSCLRRLNLKVTMVTGDQRPTALTVARAVGINPTNVYAGFSPDEKQDLILGMKERGEVVAMVGDGINDSPALAFADVGIAMASGTDVAMEAADIVLMRSDKLLDIPASLHLARTIFSRIRWNLLWACGYNVIGLPFAMGFFLPLGLHLHPMAAGAAMAASSVSVVCSSLLLKFWKRPRWMSDRGVEDHTETTAAAEERSEWWTLVEPFRTVFGRRTGGQRGDYVPLSNVETA
ncbi:hypothetical protein GP486_006675 [Trichoglossum hirsutum]|uniref:P-type Cu(+) transporter n=1 Tax=Trichoglossum hirsutum TaxID=265104 RepID=A0A9P8L7B6_9PEZI|nr:hypothetical protein GP486_006675 [Trichoglossum hirsutum]